MQLISPEETAKAKWVSYRNHEVHIQKIPLNVIVAWRPNARAAWIPIDKISLPSYFKSDGITKFWDMKEISKIENDKLPFRVEHSTTRPSTSSLSSEQKVLLPEPVPEPLFKPRPKLSAQVECSLLSRAAKQTTTLNLKKRKANKFNMVLSFKNNNLNSDQSKNKRVAVKT